MRIHVNEASPLISHSIAGVDNKLADMASRTFHRNTATHETFAMPDDDFLHLFNSTVPLQDNSWRSFRLSSKLTSLVFSELRGKASTLASWRRITKKGSVTGNIGQTSSRPSVTWIPSSQTSPPHSESNSSLLSPNMSAMATAVEASRSAPAPSKSLSAPSARLSKWTDARTHYIAPKAATGSPSNAK